MQSTAPMFVFLLVSFVLIVLFLKAQRETRVQATQIDKNPMIEDKNRINQRVRWMLVILIPIVLLVVFSSNSSSTRMSCKDYAKIAQFVMVQRTTQNVDEALKAVEIVYPGAGKAGRTIVFNAYRYPALPDNLMWDQVQAFEDATYISCLERTSM